MFIVAIDGPAGTGKGTITKIVAEKLGLVTIDTGATYRCITLAMIKQNVKLEEEEKIKEILEKSKIEFKNINGEQHTFLNDEDVSKDLPLPEHPQSLLYLILSASAPHTFSDFCGMPDKLLHCFRFLFFL